MLSLFFRVFSPLKTIRLELSRMNSDFCEFSWDPFKFKSADDRIIGNCEAYFGC
jgi:alpha-glucosidase (family GH31 glycosyl hydrolase)